MTIYRYYGSRIVSYYPEYPEDNIKPADKRLHNVECELCSNLSKVGALVVFDGVYLELCTTCMRDLNYVLPPVGATSVLSPDPSPKIMCK